jgi:soluble lytic murein transglycosylase-like protein
MKDLAKYILPIGAFAFLFFSRKAIARPLNTEQISNLPFTWERLLSWYPLAKTYGEKYGVEPELILAIIKQESKGYQMALGDNGNAYGLMQVTQGAVTDVNLGSPSFSPSKNIEQGTAYFKRMLDFTGSEFQALRAYNAGYEGSKNSRTAGFNYATIVSEYKQQIQYKLTGESIKDWFGDLFD